MRDLQALRENGRQGKTQKRVGSQTVGSCQLGVNDINITIVSEVKVSSGKYLP